MDELDRLFNNPDYVPLRQEILNELDGCPDALRPPDPDIGGSLHARIVVTVCKTCKLDRGVWNDLPLVEKIEWMLETLHKLKAKRTTAPEQLPQSVINAKKGAAEAESREQADEAERKRRQPVIDAWERLYKSRPEQWRPYDEHQEADREWLNDRAERLAEFGERIAEAGYSENLKLAHDQFKEKVAADVLMESFYGDVDRLLRLLRQIPHSTTNWWSAFNCDCPQWLFDPDAMNSLSIRKEANVDEFQSNFSGDEKVRSPLHTYFDAWDERLKQLSALSDLNVDIDRVLGVGRFYASELYQPAYNEAVRAGRGEEFASLHKSIVNADKRLLYALRRLKIAQSEIDFQPYGGDSNISDVMKACIEAGIEHQNTQTVEAGQVDHEASREYGHAIQGLNHLIGEAEELANMVSVPASEPDISSNNRTETQSQIRLPAGRGEAKQESPSNDFTGDSEGEVEPPLPPETPYLGLQLDLLKRKLSREGKDIPVPIGGEKQLSAIRKLLEARENGVPADLMWELCNGSKRNYNSLQGTLNSKISILRIRIKKHGERVFLEQL